MLTTGKPYAIHKFTPNGDILPHIQSSSYTQREYERVKQHTLQITTYVDGPKFEADTCNNHEKCSYV